MRDRIGVGVRLQALESDCSVQLAVFGEIDGAEPASGMKAHGAVARASRDGGGKRPVRPGRFGRRGVRRIPFTRRVFCGHGVDSNGLSPFATLKLPHEDMRDGTSRHRAAGRDADVRQ